MGIMGCGDTPRQAWDDMWSLYKEALRTEFRIDYITRAG